MNSKIILPEEIVEEIIKFAYEPKRYSISEGGDNIIDFMRQLNENDEIEHVTNNQMGYVIYKVVSIGGKNNLEIIFSMEDEDNYF